MSAIKGLAMEWLHEIFGKRNVVERWFFYIKHRMKKFYKRFPWNAKYTSGEKLFKQPRLPEETIPNSITLKVSK